MKKRSYVCLTCLSAILILNLYGCGGSQNADSAKDSTAMTGDSSSASVTKDWKIGVQLWTFHYVPFVQAIEKADSTAAIYSVTSMSEIVSNSISTQRLTMMLLGVFAALALTLSAIGIYGVISYLTGQRIHEIGVRIALGASSQDVLRMVLGEGMRTTLIGVGFGIAAAIGLTRLISQVIYGVGATDPFTFIGVAVLLIAVALLACYIPARRAMRVDPMIALRYE